MQVSNKLRKDHTEPQDGAQNDITRVVRTSEAWARLPQPYALISLKLEIR